MSSGLLAGIGLTRLRVYDQRPAPDGTLSGCAHVHAYTDEAYYVIAGRGALELHDVERGFRRVPLEPGDFVQFGPGTLHRSVNETGLDILALMSNSGLAERGDARIYFGAAVDADPAEFERLRSLPKTHGLDGALQRRDASTLAYMRADAPVGRRTAPPTPPNSGASSNCTAGSRRRTRNATNRSSTAARRTGCASRSSGCTRRCRPRPRPPPCCATPAPAALGMCGVLRQVPDPVSV